jgi:geranylgeranyl reductase family protein
MKYIKKVPVVMAQYKEYDAIVVGGGPAGLITAGELAKGGFSVLVLEEHSQIGLPDHCAGLISIDGLKRIDVNPSPSSIQNLVSDARFIAPNGSIFEVGGDEDKAYVLNRGLFDKSLAVKAIESGTEIMLSSRVTQAIRKKSGFLCKVSSGKTYLCKLLVDSEGISCRILKSLGLPSPSSDWILPAVQFEVSGLKFNPKTVELYLGQNIAPGFFAWSIPMSDNSSKIGLAVKGGNPLDMLGFFREKFFPDSQVFSIRMGNVVLGGPIAKTFDDNLLVVGDAAGQTKPTTGGGVVVGGLCAKIAGSVGREALLEGDLSANTLSKYETRWKSVLDGELSKMQTLRRLFSRLSDDSLNKILDFALNSGLRTIIEEKGDMDFQGEIISHIIRQPGIYSLLLSLGGDVLASLLK